MEKKLMYQLSDNDEVKMIVMDLSGIMAWIEADMGELTWVDQEEREYTIKPVFMTEEEYENLPEAEF